MVGDTFAVLDAEAAPACALGSLEALEQVEEGNGRVGRFGVAMFDILKNCDSVVSKLWRKRDRGRRRGAAYGRRFFLQDIPL